MTTPIRLTREIRTIEDAAGALKPSLMERAAAAAADLAVKLLGDRGKDVRVRAGPGHHGGDA